MKKFFEEKKRALKFKLAGPGQKLSEETSSNQLPNSKNNNEIPKRVDTEEGKEKRNAVLAAALQRSQGTTKPNEHIKKLKKTQEESKSHGVDERERESCSSKDINNEITAPGVFFKCPAIDPHLVLPRIEWNDKIKAHISDLKETDGVLGSILQIKSLNSENESDECIQLLTRYLRNIIDNPENDKYKSIRMRNPKFSEKVLGVEGGLDFLLAAGFEKKEADDSETYLRFTKESTTDLEVLIQSLLEINGLELELDRDFKMFEPKDVSSELTALPDDFFEITVADIKKQQQQRTAQLEKESMLMTKKMRELEKAKNAPRKPLFSRIRVRLPNEIVIQGTFSVKEVFRSLREFIDEHLVFESEYILMSPPSCVHDEKDDEKTFDELNLKPAVQLILKTSSENIIFKSQQKD